MRLLQAVSRQHRICSAVLLTKTGQSAKHFLTTLKDNDDDDDEDDDDDDEVADSRFVVKASVMHALC